MPSETMMGSEGKENTGMQYDVSSYRTCTHKNSNVLMHATSIKTLSSEFIFLVAALSNSNPCSLVTSWRWRCDALQRFHDGPERGPVAGPKKGTLGPSMPYRGRYCDLSGSGRLERLHVIAMAFVSFHL
jgi:hypothetical protein